MMRKFKSRKFWMSVISAILVVANEGLGLGISSETVMTFAALVASFIFSEAYIDGKRAEGVPNEPNYNTSDSTGE